MPGPDGTTVRAFYRTVRQVRAGDWLPDYGAHAVADPVEDPDDGAVWVALETGEDIRVTRRKVWLWRRYDAPAWVREALESYRDARHAWEALRESGTPVPGGSVAGAAGSVVACYQLSDEEFRAVFPVPRLSEYLRAAGVAQRRPADTMAGAA